MGTLILPETGAVYVDTSPIIYSLEKHEQYESLLQPLWQAMDEHQANIVTSSLTLLETLIIPFRKKDSDLIDKFEAFLTGTNLILASISNEILLHAAKLRAELNLKTPDAIHAATALSFDCKLFLTNDADFRRVESLNIVILNDLLDEN